MTHKYNLDSLFLNVKIRFDSSLHPEHNISYTITDDNGKKIHNKNDFSPATDNELMCARMLLDAVNKFILEELSYRQNTVEKEIEELAGKTTEQ